jgi:hypothetical protein
VHFFPAYHHYVRHSGIDWTAIAAIGTLALAFVTVWLAVSTRKLARASTDDQRAQWRPILSVANADGSVSYDYTTGELSLGLRNVGRGPAFGVRAELRMGDHPIGSSIPGYGAAAIVPGEAFPLRARVADPSKFKRGNVMRIEVTYYDVTDYWHKSHFMMTGRRPPGDTSATLEPRISSLFFEQMDRLVAGSPQAEEEARLANEPLAKRMVHRIKRLL